jgi:hypothetical protein
MALVMVNSYSSQLASYLTLPVFEKPVNSFEDLANRPDLPMTVASSSVFLQTLMVVAHYWEIFQLNENFF